MCIILAQIMILKSLMICLSMKYAVGQEAPSGEPKCFSRYDYDHKVLTSLVTMETKIKQIQDLISEQSKTNEGLRTELKAIARDTVIAQNKVQEIESVVSLSGFSATYIRWGRTICPGNGTALVYDGFVGGSHQNHGGGAANYLCLPKDPTWAHYQEGLQGGLYIYGGEYEFLGRSKAFFGANLQDHDAPCSVCRTKRANLVTIPAINRCPDGWTLEYYGYLVGGHHGHTAASEFICLDGEPETVDGGEPGHDGKLFYFVEAVCGTLKCPPYISGRELTCAVCSI